MPSLDPEVVRRLRLLVLFPHLEAGQRETDDLRALLADWERRGKALEKLTVDQPLEGRAFKGNEELPGAEDFYRSYNAGIKVQFEYSSGVARAALSPEPAVILDEAASVPPEMWDALLSPAERPRIARQDAALPATREEEGEYADCPPGCRHLDPEEKP